MKKGFIKNIAAPVFRGILKSVPFGGIIVEGVTNIKSEFENKNKTDVSEDKTLPHNWISILVQLLCVIGIAYAFITKQITIEQFLDLLPK